MSLRTPAMRAIPEENKWLLLEDWEYTIKPHQDGPSEPVIRVITAGYSWDGASKPFHDRALFVPASSSWKLVVPSLEHDDLCDNRDWAAAHGINSKMAARHFRRLCERHGVAWNDCVQMYWAVRLGGPQWDRTDI